MKSAAIVCVDDNEGILHSLGEQLERAFGDTCDVELAASGPAALDLCAELSTEGLEIPVIISDQQMPGMRGDRLLSLLHERYPQTLLIMLTGQSDVQAVTNAVNTANLYRFIPKPWDAADLILTVKEALRRYFQDQQLSEQQWALQQSNTDLAQSLSLLQATLDATADGILVVDNQGAVTHYNRRLTTLWELPLNPDSDQLLTILTQQIAAPQPFEKTYWSQPPPLSVSSPDILTLKNGRLLECLSHPQSLAGEVVGCVWSFRDVTEQQQAERLIRYQANYDDLTGIANRRQFYTLLGQLLETAQRKQECLAVMFLDLDHFKLVNDSLGHMVGDRLLHEVVQRLLHCSREQDVLARWGGDEFTVALPNVRGRQEAAAVARRFLAALQPSFNLDGHLLCITSSIGIALFPDDGQTADTLLQNADAALYLAKEEGRNNYQCYSQVLNSSGQDRLALAYDLTQALERGELEIYYQPQLDTQTGRIAHLEALVRWQHPRLGVISPADFIAVAEQNDAIITLGRWVLQTACEQAHNWHQLGLPILVGVNLSPRQLRDENLLQTVAQTLTKTGLESQFLELEITESATLHNLAQAQSVLMALHDLGVNIALDDFGTGYSSLSYLKQFPLNTLKIDRSFVMDLLTHEKDVAIAKAILELGRGLGLRVVAEGVENPDLLQLLKGLGCRYIQGYVFTHPLPAARATQFLQTHELTLKTGVDVA